MVMSVFALYVFASGARAAARLQSSLALAVAVSLFTTLPWIALNTSWDRSFARLKTLPLGRGRTEGVVGYWYGQRKDYANAHAWLDRSLEIYPGNLSSTIISGYFYLQEGKFLDGAKSFYMATRLRPSFMSYRVRLVDALVRAGQPEAAVTEAETLVEKWPTNAQAFAMYGIALHGVGRVDEARAALGGAIQMAPNEVAYRGALANLAIEGGYELTLKTLWQRVAGE
jgi:tetratricopeptide (TPR) repeat protein